MIIDIHSHFYPDSILDMETRFGSGSWPGFRKVSAEKGMITLDGKDYRPIYDACWNPARRIEELDKYGVDSFSKTELHMKSYKERSGYNNPLSNPNVRSKINETNIF